MADAPYRLIIVDDEHEIRAGLASYYPWRDLGFDVVGSFESAQAALSHIEANVVDVALSDIRMPRMNGLEFAKRLRDLHPDVRVVFLTGYKDFDYLKTAMECKAFDYLLKPVTSEKIEKTFGSLRRDLDAARRTTMADAENGELGIVAAVKTYVAANLATTTLEDAAGHIHLHPNYLSRLFKNRTGMAFSDYLLGLKMAKAMDLMKDHALKTYHISEAVGYANPNNFTRAFKRYFGKAPRGFREL